MSTGMAGWKYMDYRNNTGCGGLNWTSWWGPDDGECWFIDPEGNILETHPGRGRHTYNVSVGWTPQVGGDNTYRVQGSISDFVHDCGWGVGNGVNAGIQYNGRWVWGPVYIPPNGSDISFDFNALANPSATPLYFAVDPNGNYGCDGTAWRINISGGDSSPPVADPGGPYSVDEGSFVDF